MQNFFDFSTSETRWNFEKYDNSIILKSNDPKTQVIFNKVLSVFDKNKNGKLDSSEIMTIFANITQADKDSNQKITTNEVRQLLKQNNILSKLKMSPDEIIKFIKIIDNTIIKSFKKAETNTRTKITNIINAKYPKNKYEHVYDSSFADVIDKKTGKTVVSVVFYRNGDYRITKNHKSILYDKNGNIIETQERDKSPIVYRDPISENLYKDITAKNKFGLPTTGKNFEKHLRQINNKNIVNVLDNYKRNYGESLFDAINGEWGLDKNIKARAIKYLNNCIINTNSWCANEPNTKIDRYFKQGETGDCWFLASISAIQRSPKGQNILNNMIKDNLNGTYTVKFKGAKNGYLVNAIEVWDSKKLAGGDLDVRILELAAMKHFNISGIDGGNSQTALNLLLGEHYNSQSIAQIIGPKPNHAELRNLCNNPNIVMTCSTYPTNFFASIIKKIPENAKYKDDIQSNHTYAVCNVDDKNIYLKNPYNSKRVIAIPLDIFDAYWKNVQYTEIK